MESTAVKELMVPIEEYATVRDEETLYDAVMALEEMQEKLDRKKYRYLHRAILVFDKHRNIIGKISLLDVLRALKPDQGNMVDRDAVSHSGYSTKMIETIMEKSTFIGSTLANIYHRASQMKVKDFMYIPSTGEYIEEGASIEEAIHKFISGHYQSLIVAKGKAITGILRVTDVFNYVLQRIKQADK